MSRAETARDYFKKGYACSQAVALAFKDLTTLSEEQIASATLGFGGGFGRQRLVCGAVSGMVFIAGLIFSDNTNTPENKLKTYEIVRSLCDEFSAKTGSLICAELLNGANVKVEVGGNPELRTQEYYKKRPCDELVYIATDILERFIDKNM
jgi:C_GCAxxG_C_C family probable redox protein